MVRVWLADITPLMEESVYRQYYQELPGWRRKKADKYCFAKGRAESAGVWSLWRRVRAQYALGEDAVQFVPLGRLCALCVQRPAGG